MPLGVEVHLKGVTDRQDGRHVCFMDVKRLHYRGLGFSPESSLKYIYPNPPVQSLRPTIRTFNIGILT